MPGGMPGATPGAGSGPTVEEAPKIGDRYCQHFFKGDDTVTYAVASLDGSYS